MQFSPPAAVNPDMVMRPKSIVMRPRAIWLMDPKGVQWLQIPDTTRPALNGIQFTMGLMDSFSGSNPLAEGQPTRNMPRAGFALSSMLNLSLADIKDAAQMIEDMILTPLLSDLYSLAVEFIEPEQIIAIPGSDRFSAQSVSIVDLYGEWSFKWIGSVQAQDQQVRAQRLVATLGMLAKLAPFMQPQLEAEGKTVDWEYIWRRVWRDSFGERGLGSVIRRLKPQEVAFLQQQRQLQQQQSQVPPVKINLSGQLDPLTTKLLSGENTPTPLGPPPGGAPAGPGGGAKPTRGKRPGGGQPGARSSAPASSGQATEAAGRAMTAGFMSGGAKPGGAQ